MQAASVKTAPTLEVVEGGKPSPAKLQRARGHARLSFKRLGNRSVLDDLFQSGCMKVRLPRRSGISPPEAVLINTSGGLTDNDALNVECTWQSGTSALVTTQACERVYRSRQDTAHVETRLTVKAGAEATWLPQETILFDGGRLSRHTYVDLEANARLLACEPVILGRPAMGEHVHTGALFDRWTIRQNGKAVFQDRFGLTGDLARKLDRDAIGAGARAWASIIECGGDLEKSRDLLVPVLKDLGCPGGCSHLGEVLLVRVLAANGYELRKALAQIFSVMRGTDVLPGVWSM